MSADKPRALVMGLGAFGGGLGVTRHLVASGYEVTVTDRRNAEQLSDSVSALVDLPVKLVLGEHRERDFRRAELVAVNPAVPIDDPLVRSARENGARITSEIELFLGANPGRVVAITGTQGKSSTCHILAHLLKSAGRRVHLGGNIGGSLLEAVHTIEPEDLVVLELSSYQLESLEDPKRAGRTVVAVCITNLLADHLERHGDIANYRAAKARILELLPQGAYALLPRSEAELWSGIGPGRRRVLFEDGSDPLHSSSSRSDLSASADLRVQGEAFLLGESRLASLDRLRLPGNFQRANALCALGLGSLLGVPTEALEEGLAEVPGLPHRMEFLGTYGGRGVHDNGVSTTPDSTVSALLSFGPRCDLHLILGGRAKELDFGQLIAVAAERATAATCFGESGEALAERLLAAGLEAHLAPTLEEATRWALERAAPGAEVLFSPACASFDAYLNFRERALAFRAALPAADATPAARKRS